MYIITVPEIIFSKIPLFSPFFFSIFIIIYFYFFSAGYQRFQEWEEHQRIQEWELRLFDCSKHKISNLPKGRGNVSPEATPSAGYQYLPGFSHILVKTRFYHKTSSSVRVITIFLLNSQQETFVSDQIFSFVTNIRIP